MNSSPRKSRAAWLWLSAKQLAVVLLGFYVTLLTFLYFDQRNLIFAGSSRQGAPDTRVAVKDSSVTRVSLRTISNVPVEGYFASLSPKIPPARRTVLFFYGNGNCANDCWDIVDHFRSLGCSVMIVDYPGYGMSGGVASDTGCYDAANAAYEYLRSVRKVPADQIVAAGWSLGSAVAIHLAARRQVAGLVTFSAFTSMAAMASREYPIVPEFLVRVLLKYPFPSEVAIRRVHCQVFVAHGALDKFVPPRMARVLMASAGGPVRSLIVRQAEHNDIMHVGGDEMYGAITKWMSELPAGSPAK